MRPEHPSGKVVDLEGEELEELIEVDRPQPFAETAEVDLPAESGAPARARTPSPDPMRTGPGRNHPPSQPLPPVRVAARAEPLARVGTEPMHESVPSSPTGPVQPEHLRADPIRPDPTAPLRKSASAAAIAPSRPQARSAVRKPKSRLEDRIDSNLGSVLGSYRIISAIGEGGMGRVYLAEHVKLGRRVALKLLRPEYAVKRDAVSRFFKEAQAVNRIRHENIVDITDFVELETGETFIIMELLEGDDLADLTRKADQPMPLHRAMKIALQVCDALEAAHRVGVIHRDLKPDNIFILNTPTKKDFVKLLDFGVAKLLTDSTESDGWQTAAGSVIGTPAYMSPEQASGLTVDARSDIYSLGAILYELFTGHPVFRAKSFGEYVVKHMNDDPIPPRDLADAPKIPAALERVILRCLEKEPSRRYGSVTELREDLARATATVQTMVETVPVGPRPDHSRRRRLLIALPIGVGVVGLAIGAFWLAAGLSIDEVTRPARDPYMPIAASSNPAGHPATSNLDSPDKKVVTAKLTLITEPRGAAVYRKGETESLGRTPVDLRLPNIGEEIEFVFRLAGYEDAVEKVTVTDNALYSIPLERKRATGDTTTTGVSKGPPRRRPTTKKVPRGKVAAPAAAAAPKADPKVTRPKSKNVGREDQLDPFNE